MSPEEKHIRRGQVADMFTVLGVQAGPDQMRLWLNATAFIPPLLFAKAIAKLIRNKADGYQTAPQPGQCWAAARSLIPQSQWEYHPGTGSIPPKWFRSIEEQNEKKVIEWQQKAIPENAREFAALADHVLGAQK
jgi:hypothetical protein